MACKSGVFWGLKDLGILRSRSPPKYGIYDPISILIYIWDLNWSKSIEIDLNRSRSWKDLRSAKHWVKIRFFSFQYRDYLIFVILLKTKYDDCENWNSVPISGQEEVWEALQQRTQIRTSFSKLSLNSTCTEDKKFLVGSELKKKINLSFCKGYMYEFFFQPLDNILKWKSYYFFYSEALKGEKNFCYILHIYVHSTT